MKNLPDSDFEAEDASGRQLGGQNSEIATLLQRNANMQLICQLYEVFLKVGVIKYNNYT